MDDLNILFHRQGMAHFAHASALTSACRALHRAALAECDRLLDAARQHTAFAPAAPAA